MSGGFASSTLGRGMMGGFAGRGDAGGGNPSDPENSLECRSYQATSDVGVACSVLGTCPADFTSEVSGIEPEFLDQVYARVGCGLTSIIVDGGLGGSMWTFDTTGALVGYVRYSDTGWGPCGDSLYKRGTTYDVCSDYRDCALRTDATVDEPCLCVCPGNGGLVDAPLACVYQPGELGLKCQDHLSGWVVVGMSGSGVIRKGCNGWAELEWKIDGYDLHCVYDESETLIGAERDDSAEPCPGVIGWRNGESYPTCTGGEVCTFGSGSQPLDGAACTNYPFF